MQAALYKIDLGGQVLPLRFVRNNKARRYILRLLPGGIARVTIPRGGSLADAQAFAQRNKEWIRNQHTKSPADWTDGSAVLYRGEPVLLQVANGRAAFAGHSVPLSGAGVRIDIEAFLRTMAEEELPACARELARQSGVAIGPVRVRNQRTRWGSCSSRGGIALNWRLIQTPAFVRDYIIIHELMHLRELNHSERFWRHVAAACPEYQAAERWLRKHCALLR